MKVLSNHYSPETAYVVDDYPYGFKLRCKIRYWLEVQPNKGTRLWSQTTNPKKGDMWNKPKASTYYVVGAMYLNDEGHVHWSGLSMYNASETREWLSKYSEGITEEQKAYCEALATLSEKRAAKKAAEQLAEETITTT